MIEWPDGRRVAVMITGAVELWSPGTVPTYAPMAQAWPLPAAVDTHSASWSRYGVTTGIWTLLDVIGSHALPATFAVNGMVADRHPDVVRAVHDAGHEVAAHSYAQDVIPALLDEPAERANIERCTALLQDVTGVRPRGWASPRASGSSRTTELLGEYGYLWSGDHGDREFPEVTATTRGPMVRIMLSDLSDVRGFSSPRTFCDTHVTMLDDLLAAPGAGIFTLTVHAHVGGRPVLASMIDRILGHVERNRDDLWIATRRQVADHVLRGRSDSDTKKEEPA